MVQRSALATTPSSQSCGLSLTSVLDSVVPFTQCFVQNVETATAGAGACSNTERTQHLYAHSLPRVISSLLARSRFDQDRGLPAARDFLLRVAELLAGLLQRRPDVSDMTLIDTPCGM